MIDSEKIDFHDQLLNHIYTVLCKQIELLKLKIEKID